uniref:TF_AP-2 domain-containing protein n=1 Tax=Rhabditophanes sp. KR3021 TaxID=114890 RepID=A0AC35TTN3_9BILA
MSSNNSSIDSSDNFPTNSPINSYHENLVNYYPNLQSMNGYVGGMSTVNPLGYNFGCFQPTIQQQVGNSNATTQEKIPSSPEDLEVFENVLTKMTLLNDSVKQKVTVGELKRRIALPEKQNASSISRLLRIAKTSKSGDNLRKRLNKLNINVALNGRKTIKTNCFSTLTEEEVRKFSDHLNIKTSDHFPYEKIAKEIMQGKVTKTDEIAKEQQILSNAVAGMNLLKDLLERDSAPFMDQYPSQQLSDSVQSKLDIFSKATHSFGVHSMINSIQTASDTFLKINELRKAQAADYPQMLCDILVDIKNQFGDIPIYVTENGSMDIDGNSIEDQSRIGYLGGHINGVHNTIQKAL